MLLTHEKRAALPLDGPSHSERKNARQHQGDEFDSILPGNPWSRMDSWLDGRVATVAALLLICTGPALVLLSFAIGDPE